MIDLVYDVFDKPRDPLYESPEVADWLTSSGYKLAYDGTYKRITNIGGAQQIETMQPDQAKRLYQSQQYVLDAAQLPSSAPDYLSQIQGMLQASNQQQGGASSNQYSNPYEKRLAEIMNDPDQIANTNAYKFRTPTRTSSDSIKASRLWSAVLRLREC